MAALRAVVACAREIFSQGGWDAGGADAIRRRLAVLAALMDELEPTDFNIEAPSQRAGEAAVRDFSPCLRPCHASHGN
eukprot:SAG31_NODE_5221_length_2668_cov_1.401323_1_plen_78_part_00